MITRGVCSPAGHTVAAGSSPERRTGSAVEKRGAAIVGTLDSGLIYGSSARITTQRAVLLDTRARRAGSTFRILLVSSARSRARPLPEPAEPAPAATVATTWAAFGAAVLVTAHD